MINSIADGKTIEVSDHFTDFQMMRLAFECIHKSPKLNSLGL